MAFQYNDPKGVNIMDDGSIIVKKNKNKNKKN